MKYTPFTVDQSLSPSKLETGGGFDNNALMSLMLAGQSIYNYGQDTSKPIDLATPMGSYLSNINKAKMLKALLAKKDVPQQGSQLIDLLKEALSPNTTSTIKIDGKGLSMQYDPNSTPMLKSFLSENQQLSTDKSLTPTPQLGGNAKAANPFGSDQSGLENLTASDLVGLSTQDLATMLQAKEGQDRLATERGSLANKSVLDVMNILYHGKLMKNIDSEIAARTAAQNKIDALDQPFPISDPVAGELTLRQWNTLPEDQKRYDIYVAGTKRNIGGEPLSKDEFEDLKPSDQEKLFKHFEKDPELFAIAKEYRKAGATRIDLSTKITEKKAMSELEGQLYFSDPRWTGDLSKHLSSEDVQNTLFRSDNPKQMRTKEIVKFIEDKITAGGGRIVATKLEEDGIGIWTVYWPSKDTREIRFKIK